MKTLILFLLFTITALPAMVPEAARAAESSTLTFSNGVSVIDGDSLMIGNLEVRLLCLDAVELLQTCRDEDGENYPCGKKAQQALQEAIGSQAVKCFGDEADMYKRPLVRCQTGEIDLSRAMVEKGWAIATCEWLKPRAAEARDARRGIWRGKFLKPYTWRKAHPRVDAGPPREEEKAGAEGGGNE